ncbi:MAG: FAD-binding protein [Rivularia sp. (in: Bacteria)]|nr:FAD-binding protein [Rivularia sp. MS3]
MNKVLTTPNKNIKKKSKKYQKHHFDENQTKSKRQIFNSAVSLYSFTPDNVYHPTKELEIVKLIRQAAQNNQQVRAIGSLHSAAPIPATTGICIVLDKYRNLVKIDGSLVTVQAGMKIWELNEILAEHNLALPTLGTIVQQTVSGAISTGTHGGSLDCKSLSGYVHSLKLIKADGSVLEVEKSQDIFKAVIISMGLLGIVSTITFDCVRAFSLQSKVSTLSIDNLIEQFDEIHHNNKYVDIRYSPITDKVQIVKINPTLEAKENGGWHPVKKSKIEWQITDSINKLAQRLFNTHRLNWLQKWCIDRYDKTLYSSPYGRSDFVLTHFDATSDDLITNGDINHKELDPVADMEIAIPYSHAKAALTTLCSHFHQTRKYPSMNIHIRCSAAEDFWLSPAYGEAICWIEFWEYPCTGKFFKEIVEVLKPFKFRCHWGKQIPVEHEYLKKQYEKWQDFIQLREDWDSQGIFLNPCLKSYFYS